MRLSIGPLLWAASLLALWLGAAPPALAATTGPQYGSIGQYGQVWRGGGFDTCLYNNGGYNGQNCPGGKFIDPVGFAVDTQDTTPGGNGTAIYVLDRTSNLPGNLPHGSHTSWRLQKLDDRGNVLGSTQFTLPLQASNANRSGVFNYEMQGLTVDPTDGVVYALMVAFCDNSNYSGCQPPYVLSGSTEYVEEVLAWDTTPSGGHLVSPAGLGTDTLSTPVSGFSAPGRLSSASQLSAGGAPEADGAPQIVQPEGLAIDSTGAQRYLAIESADATANAAGAGITQICTSASCPGCPSNLPAWDTCYDASPKQGDIRLQWSSAGLAGLPNDNGDENFPPAGMTAVPAGSSTAPPGSLTVLLDEQSGGGPGFASNLAVVNVPANLTDTPSILSSGAPTSTVAPAAEDDDAQVATSDQSPETPTGDPDNNDGGPIPDIALASPQVLMLSDGLYAGDFEPDPVGAPDPQNPDGQPGLWSANDPAVRLIQPLPDWTLANDPTTTTNPPLTTLFDTLGDPTVGSPCNLSDAVSAANAAPSFPSLAAGANGTLWVLTRGYDSSGGPGGLVEGGRYLIEFAPGQGDPCPAPTGTFTVAPAGGSPQGADSPTPLSVPAGSTVDFDACPPPTANYPNCPPTGPIGINNLGAATAEYEWNFGDGSHPTVVATVPGPDFTFLWPSPTTSHEYQAPGHYTVTLTMLGDFGTYVQTGTVDVIAGEMPEASFTDSTSGLTVNVDGSASTPSPGNQIIAYEWNWGDGQIDDSPTPDDSHTFAAPGTYTVTLSVLDSEYAHSPDPATEQVTVTVPPSPPAGTPPASGASAPPPVPGRPVVIAIVHSRKVTHGRVGLVLSCPFGQSRCHGTIVLATIAGHGPGRGKAEDRPLLLGRASFTIAGGRSKLISIRLSRQAMALLSRSRLLWTEVTIRAVNPQGKRYEHSFRLALQPTTGRRVRSHR